MLTVCPLSARPLPCACFRSAGTTSYIINDDDDANSSTQLGDTAASFAKPAARKRQRLVSLDAVRGLTVGVMILVDNLGDWWPAINHSPWNYTTLADYVMPFFLFMVGCSMSLAFRKYRKGLQIKVLKRTAKLFAIGLLTQGSDFPGLGNSGIDLQSVRIPGILQRIAWAYLVVSMIAMYVPRVSAFRRTGYFKVFQVHSLQWLVALSFMAIYLGIMLGLPVSRCVQCPA